MPKYRKKPVEINAIRFTGSGQSHADVEEWAAELIRQDKAKHPRGEDEGGSAFWGDCYGLYIDTLEGRMHAAPGDWVICGVQGEFYPCKPDIFEATYEPVEATLLSELEAAQARLDAAAKVHKPVEGFSRMCGTTYLWCAECSDCGGDGSRGHIMWPCDTAKALGLGEEGTTDA